MITSWTTALLPRSSTRAYSKVEVVFNHRNVNYISISSSVAVFFFRFFQFAKCSLLVNSEHDVEIEEEEDEEELYELASLPNGVTSDVSSEADGGQGDEQSEMFDSNEKDAASSQSGATLDTQRAIIEEIRLVLFYNLYLLSLSLFKCMHCFVLTNVAHTKEC